jgi:hypothetical protein
MLSTIKEKAFEYQGKVGGENHKKVNRRGEREKLGKWTGN